MTTEPTIEVREPQPYAAVGGMVAMDEISAIADRFAEVFGAVDRHGVAPAGAPFLRYRVIGTDRVHVEACVPTDAPLSASGDVAADTLPGGRYAVAVHRGDFAGLRDASAHLCSWASTQGLDWDTTPHSDGEEWAGRIEIYETDPSTEPDPARWVTRLAFKLAD